MGALSNPHHKGRDGLRGTEQTIVDLVCGGSSAQQWAEWLGPALDLAIARRDTAVATKLVKAGSAIRQATLHQAIRGGHAEVVDEMLAAGASLAVRDSDRNAPIHVAAAAGHVGVLRVLLARGARLEKTDGEGRTPLLCAVLEGHFPAVQTLLAAGARVTVRDHNEDSAMDLAARSGNVSVLNTLIDNGADVRSAKPPCGFTALHWAADGRHVPALEVLVGAGADVNARDDEGCAPVHLAAWCHSSGIVRALLSLGSDLLLVNNFGATPLHCAAMHCGKEGAAGCVDLLLRWGADETLEDDDGKTAVDVVDQAIAEEVHPAEEMKRVRGLLANAPADKAWRRRGLLVLCRALPGKPYIESRIDKLLRRSGSFSSRCSSIGSSSSSSGGCHGGDGAGSTSSGSGKLDVEDRTDTKRADRAENKMGSGRRFSTSSDSGGVREWGQATAWVLDIHEEGVFRKIVEFV